MIVNDITMNFLVVTPLSIYQRGIRLDGIFEPKYKKIPKGGVS